MFTTAGSAFSTIPLKPFSKDTEFPYEDGCVFTNIAGVCCVLAVAIEPIRPPASTATVTKTAAAHRRTCSSFIGTPAKNMQTAVHPAKESCVPEPIGTIPPEAHPTVRYDSLL